MSSIAMAKRGTLASLAHGERQECVHNGEGVAEFWWADLYEFCNMLARTSMLLGERGRVTRHFCGETGNVRGCFGGVCVL